MKLASFCIPHIGGTYTVARNLREGLKAHGITLRWIGIGPRGLQAMNEPGLESERAFGEVVAADESNMARQAKRVAEHLDRNGYEGLLLDGVGVLQVNIARYLPESLLRILIVHTITPGAYSFARVVRDYVHATVSVSPRIREDLIRKHGFPPARTRVIPNGIDLAPYASLNRKERDGSLRLIFLGRVEDEAKGVLWIPGILRRLGEMPVSLTVAGDGPDLDRLKARMARAPVPVEFLGAINPSRVPEVLAQHDVMLMPSRYEGLGLTLIEAMAAGCVPVASRIRGVTDWVVQDGETGLLFPVGDTRMAADAIRRLCQDPALLQSMAMGARRLKEHFTIEHMALSYAQLLRDLEKQRPPVAPHLPLEEWEVPSGLRPGIRTRLPKAFKNLLRKWRENLRSKQRIG